MTEICCFCFCCFNFKALQVRQVFRRRCRRFQVLLCHHSKCEKHVQFCCSLQNLTFYLFLHTKHFITTVSVFFKPVIVLPSHDFFFRYLEVSIFTKELGHFVDFLAVYCPHIKWFTLMHISTSERLLCIYLVIFVVPPGFFCIY